MEAKKRIDTKRGFTIAGALLAIQSASALAIPNGITEPFNLLKDIYAASNIWLFIGMWFGAAMLVVRVFDIVLTLASEKYQQHKAVLGKILFGVSALLTFYSVAIPAANLTRPALAFLAWIGFIFSYSILEILSIRFIKQETNPQKEAGTVALVYFIVSMLIGPIMSFSSRSNVFLIFIVHGIIAGIVFVISFQVIASMTSRLNKLLNPEKKIKKEMEEKLKMIALEKMIKNGKITYEEAMEFIENGGKDIKNLQSAAATSPLKMLFPLMQKISERIPEEDQEMLQRMQKEELQTKIQNIQSQIRESEIHMGRLTTEYGTTNLGKEHAYLLQVLKDLRESGNQSWIQYVGPNWDHCDFADKLAGFKNHNHEKWEKLFKETVHEGGKHRAIKLLARRINELISFRDREVAEIKKAVEERRKIYEKEIKEEQDRIYDIDQANILIDKYNAAVVSFNNKLKTLRQSFAQVLDENIEENTRRQIIVSAIPAAFIGLAQPLHEFEQYLYPLAELVKKDTKTLDNIIEIKRKVKSLAEIRSAYEISVPELEEVA